MFSAEDLKALNSNYFMILRADDRDVTVMSKNTHNIWYIHNCEYPKEGECVIFHSHQVGISYHQHSRSHTLRQAIRGIKSHDKWQLNGRKR